MHFLASIARVSLVALCLLALICIGWSIAPVLAAEVVAAPAANTFVVPWGDIISSVIAAFSSLISALVISGAGYAASRIFGAPAVAAMHAAGVDRLLEGATMAGLAKVEGAVAGKQMSVEHLSAWQDEALTFLEQAGGTFINDHGGIEGAAALLTAYASKAGYIPAEANAANFKS
jgi:hypothetical protein